MVNRREFVAGGVTGFGVMAAHAAGVPAAAQAPTMSLNVIYPNRTGARFDMAYYRATHIPLAMKVMKADRVVLIEGLPSGDAPPPYVMIAHFEFASAEALKTGVSDPGMPEVRADIPKFTDITPTVMVGTS